MAKELQNEAYFEVHRRDKLFGLIECYGTDKVKMARELSSNENFRGLFQMQEISKGKFNGLVVFANLFDKPIYVVE